MMAALLKSSCKLFGGADLSKRNGSNLQRGPRFACGISTRSVSLEISRLSSMAASHNLLISSWYFEPQKMSPQFPSWFLLAAGLYLASFGAHLIIMDG